METASPVPTWLAYLLGNKPGHEEAYAYDAVPKLCSVK